MFRRLRSRWALLGAALLVVMSSAACVQFGPSVWTRFSEANVAVTPDDQEARASVTVVPATVQVVSQASATATPAVQAGRQPTAVRRGVISELLSMSGRVAGVEEVPITVQTLGRVEAVHVRPGQVVEEGLVLFETESAEIAKSLEAARARLDVASVRLSQAEAQAEARKREAERRVETDRARLQAAVGEAEGAVRRAHADYERVRLGAPRSERQAADAAVASARNAVERAEAELARVSAPPSEADLRAADQRVWSARVALHRAEAELERLRGGPDPAELRAAEREVANALTAIDRAQADLNRLRRGADPSLLSSAQRDVQRAELALRAAQSAKSEKDRNARVAREVSIRNAELGVQEARERLARASQGPPSWEVEAAQRAVEAAQAAHLTAVERLASVNKPPDPLVLASANQAVEEARIAAANAEARYLELEAGPPADRVAAASHAVRDARANLSSAVTRQAEVNGRPTRAELGEAEERLAAAQAAADRARAEAEQPLAVMDEPDSASYDLIVLQKGLQQDRAAVEALERELAATRVVAPFAGTVASVRVRPGDPVDSTQPAVTLAKPGQPIVRAEPAEADAARLAVGQQAVVTIDGIAGAEYEASVAAIEAADSAAPIARLDVRWPENPPVLGSNAQITVTLQRKEDALLVPERAIRTAGRRPYVEVVEGSGRRRIEVQVGIVQAGQAEIVSGLTEGQLVIVGP